MKITEFLEQNGVSFYKSAQLLGKNAVSNTGFIQRKLEGKSPMKVRELEEFCAKLQDYIKKPVTADMFDKDMETVIMK